MFYFPAVSSAGYGCLDSSSNTLKDGIEWFFVCVGFFYYFLKRKHNKTCQVKNINFENYNYSLGVGSAFVFSTDKY